MRLTTSSLAVICLLVGYSSAGLSRDANRKSDCLYSEFNDKDYGALNDPKHTMCSRAPALSDPWNANIPVIYIRTFYSNGTLKQNWTEPCDVKLRVIDKVGAESILKAVNKRRNEVAGGDSPNMKDNPQPKAANMRRLTWNPELARIAQRWADQCITEPKESLHDNGHRATEDGTPTGQNGYIRSFSRQILEDDGDEVADDDGFGDLDLNRVRAKSREGKKINSVFWDSGYIGSDDYTTLYPEFMKDIGRLTDAWFNEYKKFKSSTNAIENYKFVYETGHYSQEMWAESSEIGCGWNFFSRGLREGGEYEDYTLLMHCNFKSGGNGNGIPMYKIGEPHTACDDGYKPDTEYTNLCSKIPK